MWNTENDDKPWLDLVPPDAAIPEFRYDRLVAGRRRVVIEDHGKTVVRHLEEHVPSQNVILHGVFVGDQKKLGAAPARSPTGTCGPLWRVGRGHRRSGPTLNFPDRGPGSA